MWNDKTHLPTKSQTLDTTITKSYSAVINFRHCRHSTQVRQQSTMKCSTELFIHLPEVLTSKL